MHGATIKMVGVVVWRHTENTNKGLSTLYMQPPNKFHVLVTFIDFITQRSTVSTVNQPDAPVSQTYLF
jgi:hypothetical protein